MRMRMWSLRVGMLSLSTIGDEVTAFSLMIRSSLNKNRFGAFIRSTSTALMMATSPFARNEFSRPIPSDRILTNNRHRRGNGDVYEMQLHATERECTQLAKRFDLAYIAGLTAVVELRAEQDSYSHHAKRSSNSGMIAVQGSIQANVTQVCVRTNEPFEVQLQLPLDCIVQPAAAAVAAAAPTAPTASSFTPPQTSPRSRSPSSSSKKSKQRRQKLDYRWEDLDSNSINDDDNDTVLEKQLQRMMQMDFKDDDTNVMEDEAIYGTEGGSFDVGELVAQLFWLQLDPYPKKPGTNPIQKSITG